MLRSFLWAKYSGARGLPMVPCDVCTFPKDEGGLSLIAIATQGSTLAAKWVVRCLEGSSPLHILMRHRILIAQHVSKVKW